MTNGDTFNGVPPLRHVSSHGTPANSNAEAEERYNSACSTDPYPSIPPSLLNSADIWDYVVATGMLFPFYEADLKSASYQIKLLGEAIYWDEEGKKHSKSIQPGDEFELGANSIAFVTTEPIFRLPDYIAIRFNLRIEHVHRGILLGTGPLVDPGFCGKLLIPLHNLTTNTYTFNGGEELIWVEFTKISPHARWHPAEYDARSKYGLIRDYTEFPSDKKHKDAKYYLSKASPHSPIRSSLPEITAQAAQRSAAASKAAEAARDYVESIRRRLTTIGIFGGAIAILAIGLTFYQVWVSLAQLQLERSQHVDGFVKELNFVASQQENLLNQLNALELELVTLKKNMNSLNEQNIRLEIRSLNTETKMLQEKIIDVWERINKLENGQSKTPSK